MLRILLIEADPAVARRIGDGLLRERIDVRTVPTPSDELVVEEDVVVIGLPDGDRHAICRALRSRDPRRRIVMLTPEGSEPQAVAALEAGADHVLGREGVSARELAARLRAVGRRRGGARPEPPAVVTAGPLRVDPQERRVHVEGRPVHLAETELELLLALARRPDRPLGREALVGQIWGERAIDPRTLDSVVKRLRARLGASGARIETVRGVGYRLRT